VCPAWYVQPALTGWSLRGRAIIGAFAAALLLGACGGGAEQSAGEPSGNFPVSVSTASFPASQRLAQRSNLVIVVRNTGNKTIPNIAVTLLNPKDGTAAQAFSQDIQSSPGEDLASRSRAIWIIDRPPGACKYSCQQGGDGGAVTAYSNTWALGKLAPGHSATFDWGVTAVQTGQFKIEYQIAAGLNGKAKAVTGQGTSPNGTFTVTVHQKPQQAYVNNAGQVVVSN
jgi:hypothetical protein